MSVRVAGVANAPCGGRRASSPPRTHSAGWVGCWSIRVNIWDIKDYQQPRIFFREADSEKAFLCSFFFLVRVADCIVVFVVVMATATHTNTHTHTWGHYETFVLFDLFGFPGCSDQIKVKQSFLGNKSMTSAEFPIHSLTVTRACCRINSRSPLRLWITKNNMRLILDVWLFRKHMPLSLFPLQEILAQYQQFQANPLVHCWGISREWIK